MRAATRYALIVLLASAHEAFADEVDAADLHGLPDDSARDVVQALRAAAERNDSTALLSLIGTAGARWMGVDLSRKTISKRVSTQGVTGFLGIPMQEWRVDVIDSRGEIHVGICGGDEAQLAVLRKQKGRWRLAEIRAGAIERKQVSPRLSVVILVDRSKSTSGEKLERLKAAARDVVEALAVDDRIAVMGFDNAAAIVLEPTVAVPRYRAEEAIARIQPGYGEDWARALSVASSLLVGRMGSRRHIMLVTDGFYVEDDLAARIDALRGDGITVSAIVIGTPTDALRDAIGRHGGGSVHAVEDVERLLEWIRRDLDAARR